MSSRVRSNDLVIPVSVLDSHEIVLGKTGVGKSSVMRHQVEWLLDHSRRVCVIDPKGDWYGLKVGYDGKSPGYPVVMFGDFKDEQATDVPINRHSGKAIAELILSGNRPCVIGMRGWMPSAQAEFWIDFAVTVFNSRKAGGLVLVIDEIQNFAPKERVGYQEENMALYWTKKLLSEGRGLGLSVVCGSQRPQAVHNAVLGQCETLVAMRVIHDADATAIENWLKRTKDKELKARIMDSVPTLARGEAWVWSPEVGFGPVRMSFPMFRTFDSFAPIQQQRKIDKKGWADVDLDDVKQKLQSIVEESTANDPKKLKQQVTQLQMEVNRLTSEISRAQGRIETKTEIKEVPVFDKGEFEKIEEMESRLTQLAREFWSEIEKFNATVNSKSVAAMHPDRADLHKEAVNRRPISVVTDRRPYITQELSTRPSMNPPVRLSVEPKSANSNGSLPPRHQAMINALAFYESINQSPIPKNRHAAFVGRPNDGNYRSDLSTLRTTGLIDYPQAGTVSLTELGMSSVTEIPQVASNDDLHRIWFRRLQPRHQTILEALLQIYPNTISKDSLAESCGRVNDGNFRSDLSTMRTLGIIDYPQKGTAAASDNLFPFSM